MYGKSEIKLSGGINKENFIYQYNKLFINLTCPICLSIVFEPELCNKCKVILCKTCIKKYASHEESGVINCPNCRRQLETENMEKSDIEFLNQLELRCTFAKLGCYTIIKYKNYREHVENCDFSIYYCQASNCNYKNIKSKVIEHIKYCKFSMIACEYCGINVERGTHKLHIGICDKNEELCPRCLKNFSKLNLITHLTDICFNEELLSLESLNDKSLEQLKKEFKQKSIILNKKTKILEILKRKTFQRKLKRKIEKKIKNKKMTYSTIFQSNLSKYSNKSTDDELKKPIKKYEFRNKNDSNYCEIFSKIHNIDDLLKKKRVKK